jgi:hypothetical protein
MQMQWEQMDFPTMSINGKDPERPTQDGSLLHSVHWLTWKAVLPEETAENSPWVEIVSLLSWVLSLYL